MISATFLRNRTALIITLVFVCALVLSIGAARKSGNGSRKQDGAPQIQSITPRVLNKTRSFELTDARQNLDVGGRRVELSLRNGYDKNITAWAVSVNGLLNTMDFVYSEGEDRIGIIPEAIYTTTFGFVQNHQGVAARQDLDIKVLAVVFADKSGDGDQQLVAGLLDWRRKSKERLTRIVALLDRDLNSLRTIDDTAFNGVKSRLSSLAVPSHGPNERDDVLRWLGEHHGDLSPRERIERVKETCESLLARL
ncbi:MAG TPA: hypothetical protein VN937_13410 [Blastocatellia bacterium]|nr:hypothetical protein [Blastocatellia bacterium]